MAGSDRKTRARLEFLEWEARSRPRRHKLRLVGLALLGYLYPAALVVVSFGLVVALLALGPLAWSTLHDITSRKAAEESAREKAGRSSRTCGLRSRRGRRIRRQA